MGLDNNSAFGIIDRVTMSQALQRVSKSWRLGVGSAAYSAGSSDRLSAGDDSICTSAPRTETVSKRLPWKSPDVKGTSP